MSDKTSVASNSGTAIILSAPLAKVLSRESKQAARSKALEKNLFGDLGIRGGCLSTEEYFVQRKSRTKYGESLGDTPPLQTLLHLGKKRACAGRCVGRLKNSPGMCTCLLYQASCLLKRSGIEFIKCEEPTIASLCLSLVSQ